MKILFVSSGNNKFGISPIVKAQGESLKAAGVEVEYFTVVGKGYKGYLKNIFRLRKHLKKNKYDIVHSHFFLSSVVATFANPKKLVVSLMGSDAYTSRLWNCLIKIFANRWDAVIVKSEKMKDILGLSNCNVLPNGVDFEKFYPIDKEIAREKLGWNNHKYVLFASSTNRPEKNFELASEAVELLNDKEIELDTLQDIPHDLIVYYLNAADVLLMTSKYEGSPNIIKEAMACNCPIVSTDVGDVKWVIGGTDGCYLISKKINDKKPALSLSKGKKTQSELIKETTDKLRHKSKKIDKSKSRSADVKAVTSGIKEALEFAEKIGRTKGRERIIELKLDSENVAAVILNIYAKTLNES